MPVQTSALISSAFEYGAKPTPPAKPVKAGKHGKEQKPPNSPDGNGHDPVGHLAHHPIGVQAYIMIQFADLKAVDKDKRIDKVSALKMIEEDLDSIIVAIRDAASAYLETTQKLYRTSDAE